MIQELMTYNMHLQSYPKIKSYKYQTNDQGSPFKKRVRRREGEKKEERGGG